MMVLTSQELATLRVGVQSDLPLPYTKPVINAGIQAMENWWESSAGRTAAVAEIKAALVAAGAKGATNAEARRIMKHWLQDKFRRGG